jgi:hypothetical protein
MPAAAPRDIRIGLRDVGWITRITIGNVVARLRERLHLSRYAMAIMLVVDGPSVCCNAQGRNRGRTDQ